MMQQIFSTQHPIQQTVKQNEQQQCLADVMRNTPYQVNSSMQIIYKGPLTYNDLLKASDEPFRNQMKKVGFNKFSDTIFMFEGIIQPQNVSWRFWQHPDDIFNIIQSMGKEIIMMNKYRSRICQTGDQITHLHQRIKQIRHWNQQQMSLIIEFLNLTLNHPYLKKSENILTFVNHCLPLDKWNLKVYQQVELTKKMGWITNLTHDEPPVIGYLTVTGDGILWSTKNLIQTKIQKMILFTPSFKFNITAEADDDIVMVVQSFEHQNLKVNFKQNYLAAINFYTGFQEALKAAEVFDSNRRFGSFSKRRKNCWAKLYNDGQGYFSDMCDELNCAKNQVLITDWWMTPYFLLKRPDPITKKTNRLDGVLKKIADRGVKVFIILFRQPFNILSNDSEQAHFYLQSLSRNIRVRRHPIVPQLWSHHEKCCVIDQQVGFMGGLDICFGRWDNPEHLLWNKDDLWNGADYTNQRLRGFTPGTTDQFTKSPLDRDTQPRMPWHDIALQTRGDSVIDIARHFIQYWYYVDKQKSGDPIVAMRTLGKRFERSYNYVEPAWQGDQEKSLWESQPDDSQAPNESCGQKTIMFRKRTQMFITGPERRLPELLIEARQGSKAGNMQLQLCRSASPWSIGAVEVQQSIHNAYKQLIHESEHFIYIQNQFFMGKKNDIVKCMAERIQRAHNKGQNFKVIVVMPLLPGFEGDITSTASRSLRIQVHNQFDAINRGQNSLYKRLSHLRNFNIQNYIFFFGLRNHALCGRKPITEIIYVHSKLMIVDDKRAIIGSANINDRSLIGERDSELAMVLEQQNGEILDGKPRKQTIFGLKCRLFDQHFGLSPQECGNINSPQVWSKIITNAKNNTLIYRQIFQCYPDDKITVGDEVCERLFEAKPQLYQELIPKIYAHAVEFPLKFMEDQDIQTMNLSAEQIAGEEAFL